MSIDYQTVMLKFTQVSKRYDMGIYVVGALNEINVSIRRGEFVSVMGPSGSGKSTLLSIIGTLDRPTEGKYELEGYDITHLPDKELARIRNEHFGFIFQSYNLLPNLTAIENVELPLTYSRINATVRRKRAIEKLSVLGMVERASHFPSQLSGGEQQRVAIARALIADPLLLLADEPTGNLPESGRDMIMNFFTRLNREGMAIVLVTHDGEVGNRADRMIRLTDGHITSDQTLLR